MRLGKAITHMENRIANTIAKSEGVCDWAIVNRLRLFLTLLRVYGNQQGLTLSFKQDYKINVLTRAGPQASDHVTAWTRKKEFNLTLLILLITI